MAYCVRCGVRLDEGLTFCPLCRTALPEEFIEKEQGDETISLEDMSVTREVKVPSRLFAAVSTLLLIIPLGITLIIDMSLSGTVTWSYYIMISILLLWIMLLQPFLHHRYRVFRSIINNFLAIAVFLLLIDVRHPPVTWAGYPAASLVLLVIILVIFKTSGSGYVRIAGWAATVQIFLLTIESLHAREISFSWSLGLGLPLVCCTALCFAAILFFIHRTRSSELWSTGLLVVCLLLFSSGILALVTEASMTLSFPSVSYTGWSWFVLLPCLLIAGLCFAAARSPRVHETLKRRFHL